MNGEKPKLTLACTLFVNQDNPEAWGLGMKAGVGLLREAAECSNVFSTSDSMALEELALCQEEMLSEAKSWVSGEGQVRPGYDGEQLSPFFSLISLQRANPSKNLLLGWALCRCLQRFATPGTVLGLTKHLVAGYPPLEVRYQ